MVNARSSNGALTDRDIQTSAAELISHLEVLSRRFLLQQAGADISRNEATLLRLIADSDTVTMSDASAHLGLALSSVTGVVDRLVDRKLVRRSRPRRDRRTVVVTLTAKGTKLHERLAAERIALAVGMLEPLDEKQRAEFLELFRAISTAIS